jgi:hypothetical protein
MVALSYIFNTSLISLSSWERARVRVGKTLTWLLAASY